ncbi:O-methyltransferase-like protein [Saccharopolyspora erythraea NRRL 2338] [Mycobacterium shimoidei]|uniref:O-methyltransferase-like protein [Saccharopolyspora erythraea NRRL 2338] n=1 Tax=Mycobacterium shimoidei TaxID=29313 RepID=A0A375Z397_MYCSH|nr:class I SAM-dependent methyltransferase [Mycobacterium shimoidei]SRX95455.1 O-methyltransferase-like protein [Saccharopolyspora erythraea NRRL 2338] [Mycobacterium shimoidei]
MTDKVSVDLSGPAQTMLTTLYCKALDADWDQPILGDGFAKDAVARIDYNWPALKVADRWTPLVTVRTAQFDVWASQFLAVHPEATVIHLGCGLDSRVFRLDPGPGVQWYDVDYPAVIALRERVFETRPRYHLVPTAATDPSWLEQIPTGRPTLLLAEGISMYLTEQDGVALLQHVVDRFGTGELQIDFYSSLAIRSQKTHRLQRQSGSTLHWAVDSPGDILKRVSGIRLLSAVTFFDASTFGRASAVFRLARQLVRVLPPLRRTFQYHRYAFGHVS